MFNMVGGERRNSVVHFCSHGKVWQ